MTGLGLCKPYVLALSFEHYTNFQHEKFRQVYTTIEHQAQFNVKKYCKVLYIFEKYVILDKSLQQLLLREEETMNEKTLVIIGTILAIIFGVIASLVAWFCGGKELQGAPREAIRQIFNWEITYLILAIVLGWVPVLGQLLVLGMWIANIVFCIMAFNAATKGAELKVPAIDIVK